MVSVLLFKSPQDSNTYMSTLVCDEKVLFFIISNIYCTKTQHKKILLLFANFVFLNITKKNCMPCAYSLLSSLRSRFSCHVLLHIRIKRQLYLDACFMLNTLLTSLHFLFCCCLPAMIGVFLPSGHLYTQLLEERFQYWMFLKTANEFSKSQYPWSWHPPCKYFSSLETIRALVFAGKLTAIIILDMVILVSSEFSVV